MPGGTSNTLQPPSRLQLFQQLASQMQVGSSSHALNYWEDRLLQTTAHDECLSVSWSGSRNYALAHAFERDWNAVLNQIATSVALSNQPFSPAQQAQKRLAVIKDCHQRYASKHDGPYAHETYIFYKDSEFPPQALATIAPGLLCQIGDLPLHHYYLISRSQPVVDQGVSPGFTRWHVEPETFPTVDAMMKKLFGRIYIDEAPAPAPAPKKPGFPWSAVWATLLAVIIGAVVLAVGIYVERSRWFAEMTQRFDHLEGYLEDNNRQFEQLSLQYDSLQAELSQLIETAAHAHQVEVILERLNSLELVLASHAPQAAVPNPAPPATGSNHGPLGHTSCLAIADRDGRRIPDYLFRVHLSEAGIRVFPHPGNGLTVNSAAREAALSHLELTQRSALSASAFRQWSEGLMQSPESQDCRHYVVLNEDGSGQAGQYAHLRAVIESRFYIYRPAR